MKLSILLTTAAIMAASSGAFAATVTIDNFSTDQSIETVTTGVEVSGTVSPASGAIGGSRTVKAIGNVIGSRNTEADVAAGSAAISNGSGITGIVTFLWDAGGADLTDGFANTGIDLSILSTDLSVIYKIGVNGFEVSKTISSPGTTTFGFSEFVGVDFTNVGSISLVVSGPASFDSEFDLLAATPPAATVPLPGGLGLAVGGFAALGLLRRRRSAKS